MMLSRRAFTAVACAAVLVALTVVVFVDQPDSPTARALAVAPASSALSPPAPSPPASPSPAASLSPAASPSAAPSRVPDVPADARAITLVNATAQTVWAAATRNTAHPMAATGWVLAPGQSVTVVVPAQWGGRIWGRTGCTFDASGRGHCASGDCGGVFQCTGSGATPATLAEFTLSAWNNLDFYDVSMVDGANLPMYINVSHTTTKDPVSSAGCAAGGCTSPVACPAELRVGGGGCETACAAFNTDAYCCRNAWSGRAACDPTKWPVNYTKVFKNAEPYAYSYAYDDSATMSCRGACYYRVTFGVTPGR